MQRLVIKKSNDPSEDDQPRFELDQTGKDVAEHQGIKWVWLTCPHCLATAKFYPEFYVRVNSGEKEYGLATDHHYLCKCDHCSDIVYVKFWEVDFDPDWAFRYETHYPLILDDPSSILPKTVSISFAEAGRCLNARAAIATVVMCRRTIEAVVANQGAKKNVPLATSIRALVASRQLPDAFGALADLVRVVGNVGAHASEETVEFDQAREMYGLTRELVNAIYIMPDRVASLRKGLEEARAAKNSAPT